MPIEDASRIASPRRSDLFCAGVLAIAPWCWLVNLFQRSMLRYLFADLQFRVEGVQHQPIPFGQVALVVSRTWEGWQFIVVSALILALVCLRTRANGKERWMAWGGPLLLILTWAYYMEALRLDFSRLSGVALAQMLLFFMNILVVFALLYLPGRIICNKAMSLAEEHL